MIVRCIDLVSKRYGRLVVIGLGPLARGGKRKWHCRCDCGTEKTIAGNSLRCGITQSCGCLRLEAITKHGESRTPEYKSYHSMMRRCYNPKAADYERYGGRGITVCERWCDSLADFLSDMGLRPNPEHSLDRIDNNKGYSPENCRWATTTEQNRNQRKTVFTEALAAEVRQLAAAGGNVAVWARKHGIKENTVYNVSSGRQWNALNEIQ